MHFNGKFQQVLSIIINSKNHNTSLECSKYIKKQCEAWDFCVRYTEYKSARKGSVLKREIMIYQEAYADDIIIFKEAIRRICFVLDLNPESEVKFVDRGSIPIDKPD